MNSNSNKKKSNSKRNGLNLVSFKESIVLLNDNTAILNIGIIENESLFIRLINQEQSYYEAILPKLELQQTYVNMNQDIKIMYEWIISQMYSQYSLKYNEDKTKLLFYHNFFNINNNSQERKLITLNLKNNDNKIVINNIDKLELLKDFNNKYKTTIAINDPVIILSGRFINNEGFKNLCQIGLNASIISLDNNKISDLSPIKDNSFKNLQKLYLGLNNINNIKFLYNLNFENLIELKLSQNKIDDISSLEGVKMNKIEKLFFNDNNISEIGVFQKVNFENLTFLNLSKNNIKNISSSFENNNFEKLVELDLSNNNIEDISILEKVELNSLENLNLSFNDINKITVKKKFSFPKLKNLNINNNNIQIISIIGRVLLPKLNKINLSNNIIENIDIDKIQKLNKLQELNLSQNEIKNISFLENLEIKGLKKLILSDNKIEDIQILGEITIKKLSVLELNNNKISNIDALKNMYLKHLNTLNLSQNYIKNIRPLENIDIPIIKSIIIYNNLFVSTQQKNLDIFDNIREKYHNNHYFYIIQ